MIACNRHISSRCFLSRSIAFRYTHKEQGFTLIELLIVVVIIGVLAAMAIPKFVTVINKAKDNEAKNILAKIYTLEIAFRDQYSRYTSNLDSLGYADPRMKYWTGPVFTPAPTDTTFTAVLTEQGDIDGDKKYNNTTWTVTQESREATISGRS